LHFGGIVAGQKLSSRRIDCDSEVDCDEKGFEELHLAGIF
jgi:hypothetical protein